MQKDGDLPASGRWYGDSVPGVVFPGTYESFRDACAGHTNFADLVNEVVTWTWVWEGKGNKATNTRVALRHARAYWLSKSTGKWNLAFNARPWGLDGQIKWSNDSMIWPKLKDRTTGNQRNEDAEVMSCKPAMDDPYEIWGIDTCGNEVFRDAKAWYIATDLKLIVDDPTKPDDRDLAKYIVTVGVDFKTTHIDKTDNALKFGVNDPRKNSYYTGGYYGGYVNQACDGFHCRYRLIGKEWLTVQSISMGPQYNKGYPEWKPIQKWNRQRTGGESWPYSRSPYVLTEDEVRANPPPFHK